MFQVSTEIDFCYGHRLLNYTGKCRHLHGHNGKAVITLEGEKLDDRGMLMDFKDVKATVANWIDDTLDHTLILNENDPIAPLLRGSGERMLLVPENPTAETLARMIYRYGKSANLPIVKVDMWETVKSYATYRE